MMASTVTSAGNEVEITSGLEALLRETYLLWEPGWTNFNWRGYTYDHVQRVRGLAHTLCVREGGDTRTVELAALLHDITKAWDGDYALDAAGKRLVDADGYWQNDVRPPRGENEVTHLFDSLGLAGRLHNDSGSRVARELLLRRGIAEPVAEAVARTIVDHLRPPADAPIESRCLYDADTIDANIGLPAFVRNIYIHLHYRDARKRPDELPTDVMLRDAPLEYLGPYVSERLPAWSAGKRTDFIPKLLTPAGVALSERRLARLESVWLQLRAEVADFSRSCDQGCLSAVLLLMRNREEPSIDEQAGYLADGWLHESPHSLEAAAFVRDLAREVRGIE